MALHFSKEEFSKRKTKVLNSMKDQNIDALLMFKQESMYWLTGYDTFGYVFFQTLVLDQRGNVILLTRAPDLRQAQNTSNITLFISANILDSLTPAFACFHTSSKALSASSAAFFT